MIDPDRVGGQAGPKDRGPTCRNRHEHAGGGARVSLEWILLPTVGALIGWFTEFRGDQDALSPQKAGAAFWALGRSRRITPQAAQLARIVGETVERDLLPVDELVESLDLTGYQDDVIQAVVGHVGRRIDENLPDLLPLNIKRMIGTYARRIVGKEAAAVVDQATQRIKERVQSDIKLGELVRNKMNQFDTEQLERIVVRVASTELRAIELLGGVLGFMIGLFQAAILTLF